MYTVLSMFLEIEDRPNDFTSIGKEKGYKLTPQYPAVFNAMVSIKEQPRADDPENSPNGKYIIIRLASFYKRITLPLSMSKIKNNNIKCLIIKTLSKIEGFIAESNLNYCEEI